MKEFDDKFKNVCDFYMITHKLKNLLRKGWVEWKVNSDRIESVAEHIYGTQMLAFAINSEFNLGIDIEKVVFMLAFHELGENIIGDISLTDANRPNKQQMERKAIEQILDPMKDKQMILDLLDEYDNFKTKEAKFAKMVDKFECDLQCKFYDEMGETYSLTEHSEGDEEIRQRSEQYGTTDIAKMWIEHHKECYDYNELFREFADYVISNKVFKKN